MTDLDIRPHLLDPDAPVHPPAGMTAEQCLAWRQRLRTAQEADMPYLEHNPYCATWTTGDTDDCDCHEEGGNHR